MCIVFSFIGLRLGRWIFWARFGGRSSLVVEAEGEVVCARGRHAIHI